jgi:excinuclease ABC subunit B
VQPIGPALAELLNPAINRGESGVGSSTGLKPPPDNSWDRRAGGEAAAHRARASTRGKNNDGAQRDATANPAGFSSPPPASEGGAVPSLPAASRREGQQSGKPRGEASQGFSESAQREFAAPNYGTAATVPVLDPELARQLGFAEEEDDASLARPARNKMEALGVAATAQALETLIRDGRPEFRTEDGSMKVWTPHRPPRPEKSEGGVRFVLTARPTPWPR